MHEVLCAVTAGHSMQRICHLAKLGELMLTRQGRAALGIATAGLALFAGWMLWNLGDPSTAIGAGGVGAVLFSAFATGCALTAAKRGCGAERIAWSCLAVGFAGCVVGDLFWAYFEITAQTRPPFPTPADAAYLLLPLCVCAAAVFGPTNSSRRGFRLLLDGVIVAASLFVVAWSVGLRVVYESGNVSGVSFAVSVAYPLAALAMVTVLALVLCKTPKGKRLSQSLLLAGLIVIGFTSGLFVYMNAHAPLNDGLLVLGWVVGMYLIGAAGLTFTPNPAADVEPQSPPSRLSLWLPYAPVPFAAVAGAEELAPAVGTEPILVAGLVLIAAALTRQLILLDQNRRLLVTVADIALRDSLTGLANRTLFSDRLAHAMQLRLRNAAPVAVLLLDLVDFKRVNDNLGHSAGDELLCDVADRIQQATRTGDTVARLGGDEFAILIEDDPEIAHDTAQRVVEAFDEPFSVEGREVFVRPSLGLAVAPCVSEADVSADDLFRRADLAMYSAKRAHFCGVQTFTSDMRLDTAELPASNHQKKKPGRRDGIVRIRLLGDLRRAIDERRLSLVYQPKYSLATGAVVGVEALVRWPHPHLGTLDPGDFLPLVRQNGLMPALTEMVLVRAVEECADWHAAGIDIPVAINLSAPSLDDDTLPERIMAVLAQNGLAAESLSVEITEDLLLASVIRTRTVLDRLRENGIRVAIDDFGSGYATMTYLRELPIDELKLDRQFVAPILHDARAAAIVRSVIGLADTFGITTVAEGVGDRATAERLKEYGCAYVQGHYFSPPVSAKAIRLGVLGSALVDSRITATAAIRPSSA
jgi:diguanylate cyclase (GGDEF)-like protein